MIRLFANITAGHIIVLSLVCLIFIFKSLAVAPVSILFVIIYGLPRIACGISSGIYFHSFVSAVHKSGSGGSIISFYCLININVMTGTLAAVGAGLAVIGAGLGIGRIGGSAMEAIAQAAGSSNQRSRLQ